MVEHEHSDVLPSWADEAVRQILGVCAVGGLALTALVVVSLLVWLVRADD